MTDSVVQHAGLPHAVFLHRLAGESPSSTLEPRLGRAAFVALRLVDLLGPEYTTLHPDAFHYQYVATARCCRDLPPGATETSHLVGLVHGTHDAFEQGSVGLVLPALFAYAHYLEDEMRLEEALDVLDTLLQVGGEKMPPTDVVGARLRRARVYRKLNEFDAAEESYAEGGALAATIGDTHSELLSRIGRADTMRGRGNLVEAESSLRDILVDAERLQDREARARAHQVIAVVLSTRGQPAEAIPHEWRAFQLYDDELSRIGFERWREQCDARRESMPPNVLVDYTLKAGIGRARFGQFDRAERLLASALRIADEAGLHEFTFRIERIQAGLRDSCQSPNERPAEAAEPVVQSEAVREVSAGLAHLAGAT